MKRPSKESRIEFDSSLQRERLRGQTRVVNPLDEYYRTLEIHPGAPRSVIKTSYRRLVHIWHPDRYPDDPDAVAKANVRVRNIIDAYERLKDYEPTSEEQASYRSHVQGKTVDEPKPHVSQPRPSKPKNPKGEAKQPPQADETRERQPPRSEPPRNDQPEINEDVPPYKFERIDKYIDTIYQSYQNSWDCVLFLRVKKWEAHSARNKDPIAFYRDMNATCRVPYLYTFSLQLDGVTLIKSADLKLNFVYILGMPVGEYELTLTTVGSLAKSLFSFGTRNQSENVLARTSLKFTGPGACELTINVVNEKYVLEGPAYIKA
jgi:hypothetical protein